MGALAVVDGVLEALDRQASRFGEDSEISWVHRGGGLFMVSDGLAEAIGVALEAAQWTRGLADPTVGTALIWVATSSITCRRWRRAGQVLHHIIDPRSGLPAGGPWRIVSVAAATCVDANAAATASIVAGNAAQ